MRLLQLVALLPVVLSVACSNATAAPRSIPVSVACEAAVAYAEIVINEAEGKPLVFTSDDQPFSAPVVDSEWWRMEGELPLSAPAPPAALLQRLEDQGNRNAVSRCASVRKLLEKHRIAYGSKAVDAATSSDVSVLFKASIHTVSMPTVSADGQRAILASSGVYGHLAGGGFLQLLERQSSGNWKVVAFSPLWVS